jgi:hypothetical protein
MKKYHVFAGDDYYPLGGADYKKSFENELEAYKYAKSLKRDWYDVLETQEDGSLRMIRSSDTL